MAWYATKILVSALLLVAISEIARRSTFAGALLASLPVTTLLAFLWMHFEDGSNERIAALSTGVFWLVLPSLVLFLVLPLALKAGWNFWASLGVGIAATVACYGAMIVALRHFGIEI
jgi:hypothetical protein